MTSLLTLLLLTSSLFRALLWNSLHAALGGVRAEWTLLRIDTQGTAAGLGLMLIKMAPGVVPVVVLAARLRGWERLRLPLWAGLLACLGPVACCFPSTPLRLGVVAILSVAAVWLTRYRRMRWTVLLPLLVMYTDIFALHFLSNNHFSRHLLSSSRLLPLSTRYLAARCQQNDGQRPLNLRDEQLGPYYVSSTLLHPDELLLVNVGTGLPFQGERAPENLTSWWLRRKGDGWIFDGPSAVTGYRQNGCRMNDAIWLTEDRGGSLVGVSRDSTPSREHVQVIPLNLVDCNNMALPVCRPERRSVILSEALSGNRLWEVSLDAGVTRQLAYEPGALVWAARGDNSDNLTINDTSDLMVYSLREERVVQRIPAGAFMLDRHEMCPLDGEVATADMLGRVRLFARGADGRYRFDWGVSLPSPRNTVFSPDCRFLGVTSTDDSTVTLIDREQRKVLATYHTGPALREITFLGPRELAVADACTLTTFRF